MLTNCISVAFGSATNVPTKLNKFISDCLTLILKHI